MPYKDSDERLAAGRAYARAHRAERSASHKIYRAKNKERLDAEEALRRVEKRAQCLIAHARIRARRKGIPFALDDQTTVLQARVDAGVCELTGFPFDLRGGKRQFASPSLDRIVPAIGYVPGNVRVICFGMNAALGHWGEIALLQMIDAWQEKRSAA